MKLQKKKHFHATHENFCFCLLLKFRLVYSNVHSLQIGLFQNMPSIPSPTIMQLDPNDENIILSIPEDSGPVIKASASTLTPKKVC